MLISTLLVHPASTNAEFTLETKWGEYGSRESEFRFPHDVTVDRAGKIYVTDTYNSRIQRFDGAGTFQLMWGWGVNLEGLFELETCVSSCQAAHAGRGDGELVVAKGITVDSAGNVYVADTYSQRIQKYDSEGRFELMWGWGVDANNSDSFQVCSSSCTGGIKGSGLGQFDEPGDVAVDSVGNVYVADGWNDRIQKFSSGGLRIKMRGTRCKVKDEGIDGCDGGFYSPKGINVDSADNIYVADSLNHRIQKFGPDLALLDKWGSLCDIQYGGSDDCDGNFKNPTGIDTDASGNVYVADAGNFRIQLLGSSGEFIDKWGKPCRIGNWDPAECNEGFISPKGIAVDRAGKVSVADTVNNRIMKFKYLPDTPRQVPNSQEPLLPLSLPAPSLAPTVERHSPRGQKCANSGAQEGARPGCTTSFHQKTRVL